MTGNGDESFYCSRCGYARPLKPGEDGFRIYTLHEQRCNPAAGEQIWLPFITEDDVVRPSAIDKRADLLGSRRELHGGREGVGSTEEMATPHHRKAA